MAFSDGDVGFEGVIYHDEPDNAATNNRSVGIYATREAALVIVQSNLGRYWNGGGQIIRGTVAIDTTDDNYSLEPRLADDAPTVSCYVGPDGEPDETEWMLL